MRYKIYPLIKKNKFNCVFLSSNIVIVSKNMKSLQTKCLYRTKKIYKHSWCVHVRYKWANPLEHATIRPDLLKPVGTRSDLSRPV